MTGGAQAASTNYNAVADQHGFVVAYPDGIDLAGPTVVVRRYPIARASTTWASSWHSSTGSSHDYGVPPGQVFATGLSAGAFMANAAGVPARRRRRRDRAGCGYLGLGGSLCAVAPGVGLGDTRRCGSGGALYRWRDGRSRGSQRHRGAARDGRPVARPGSLPGAPVEDASGAEVHRFTASGCADGTEVVFVRVDGGGHEWFGGASDASATVLRHPRAGELTAVISNAMTETR